MEQAIKYIISIVNDLMLSNGYFTAVILGTLLVISESIIPVLPLAVFIAINNLVLGGVVGFLVSWIGTIIGCILSFYIFRLGISKYIYKTNLPRVHKFIAFISKVSLGTLAVIMSVPFTPAFLINIGAGLSKISFKKFFVALLISKAFCVYFWGYVGTTLIESLTSISALVKIFIMLGVTYIISVLINKKFNLD